MGRHHHLRSSSLLLLILMMLTRANDASAAPYTHRHHSKRRGVLAARCTHAVAELQAEMFRAKLKEQPSWSECPDTLWFSRFQGRHMCPEDWSYSALLVTGCRPLRAELSGAGPRVFVDIGCNKGYSSFGMFDTMDPTFNLTVPGLAALRQGLLQEKEYCGVCGECGDKPTEIRPAHIQPEVNVQLHCYDASSVHFSNLIKVKEHTMPNGAVFSNATGSVARWEIHHAAASDTVGTAKFPACETELCSLDHSTQPNVKLIDVRMTTVDFEMFHLGINYIDVLKIDAEGFDSAVLRGAERALSQRRVGLLKFEYNVMGLWRTATLRDTVDFLARYQYVCYFEGRPTLARLTGCWSDLYEIKAWANVICTHPQHFMSRELFKLSFLSQIV